MKIINSFRILPVILAGFLFFSCNHSHQANVTNQDSIKTAEDSAFLKQYSPAELKTNWKKHSVPVDSIHDGGPGKNGIPAIDYPEFVSVNNARRFLTDPDFGILLAIGNEERFYPLKILNWHEVVNDNIGGLPVAVTFCPLCGSAIVYNRIIDGDTLLFGVSGKLYESNMLMFDEGTESLWSQASGIAIAGDMTLKNLQLINSSIISYEDVVNQFPNAKVLTTNTGFERNYNEDPYADYNGNDELYFPVSKLSNRFSNKDMIYAVKLKNSTVAFPWKDLLKYKFATVSTPEGTVNVVVKNFIPSAVIKESNEPLNGYFTFWFSWFVTNGENGIVWNSRR